MNRYIVRNGDDYSALGIGWNVVGILNIYQLALESAEKGLNPYGEEEGGEWIALENTGRGRPNNRAVVPSEIHFSSVDQIEVRDKSWTTEVKAGKDVAPADIIECIGDIKTHSREVGLLQRLVVIDG